jgi:hypothetical protein
MRLKLIVLCTALFLCSCEKDNGVGTGGGALSSVPYLASGTEKYVWTSQIVDSLNQMISEEADSDLVSIAGVNEVEGQYPGLVCVKATSLTNNLGSVYSWYKATNDSLVEVAYLEAGQVPMVLEKKSQYSAPSPLSFPPSLWRFIMKKLTSDSVQIRSDLRVVHRYPLSEGREWVSFHDPFLEEREVVGTGYIKVRAGTFYCSIIKTTIDLGSGPIDLEWLDYVAFEGLVLRTLYYPNITVTTESSPDSGYVASLTERMEMVSNSSY